MYKIPKKYETEKTFTVLEHSQDKFADIFDVYNEFIIKVAHQLVKYAKVPEKNAIKIARSYFPL